MKNTVLTLQKQKEEHDKIVMVTAYDYTTAKIMERPSEHDPSSGIIGNGKLGIGGLTLL